MKQSLDSKNFGYVRLAAAVPEIKVADVDFNSARILRDIGRALEAKVELLAFPHLSLTGCSCGDLLGNSLLQARVKKAVDSIAEALNGTSLTVVLSAPYYFHDAMEECVFILSEGEVKQLATIDSARDYIFRLNNLRFGITFGSQDSSADLLAHGGAQLLVNMNAEYAVAGKCRCGARYESERLQCAVLQVSAGVGESTTDGVYSGAAGIYENGVCLAADNEIGIDEKFIVAEIDLEHIDALRRKNFFYDDNPLVDDEPEAVDVREDDYRESDGLWFRKVSRNPFIPEGREDRVFKDAIDIQVAALCKRMKHIGLPKLLIGVSGGLDSTLALLVCALACDRLGLPRTHIYGITMPGYGTSVRTRDNAGDLMEALGITRREISIVAACDRHFIDIGQDQSQHDAAFENAQARERTQILMDIANQIGGLVIGTGDLSELALGWATYNGDHMSMYAVNGSLPKTFIRPLVRWAAENRFAGTAVSGRSVKDILIDIIDTPVSPELLPPDKDGKIAQVTENLVGPYELHDFFIYHFVVNGFSPAKIYFLAVKAFEGKYGEEVIMKWLKTFIRRFFAQQYKRSCMPDGPQVTEVSLSPRGGWNMPSDASGAMFLEELDNI